MAVNKVVLDGVVNLDLSGDGISPEDLRLGVTAHDKTGAAIVGTNENCEDLNAELETQASLIEQIVAALDGKAQQ